MSLCKLHRQLLWPCNLLPLSKRLVGCNEPSDCPPARRGLVPASPDLPLTQTPDQVRGNRISPKQTSTQPHPPDAPTRSGRKCCVRHNLLQPSPLKTIEKLTQILCGHPSQPLIRGRLCQTQFASDFFARLVATPSGAGCLCTFARLAISRRRKCWRTESSGASRPG